MTEKRSIGTVSVSAGAGAGAGYSLANVIVWGVQTIWAIDATPISDDLGLILTVAGALFGGWLVKPGGGNRVAGRD